MSDVEDLDARTDYLLAELNIFPDERRYIQVPFEDVINWRLHPTRPVEPIRHRSH